MATEFLYATSHLAGDFSNPENAVGDTPSSWAGDLNTNSSYTSRWAIDDPSDPLTDAATQTIRVVARKGSNAGDPSVAVNLYENGTLVTALVADTTITSTTGQTLQGTFTDADITNRADVEIEVVQTGAGGNPSTRNSAQISHIEWEADVTAAVAIDLSGSGANAATGAGTIGVTRSLSGSGPNAVDGSGTLATNFYAIFRRTPQTGAVFDPEVDTPLDTTSTTGYVDTGVADGSYDYQVFAWTGTWSTGSTVEQVTVAAGATIDLSGSGATAAAGSGSLGVTRGLAGSGANAVDGTADASITRGLSGTGANAGTGSGVLSTGAEVALSGSGANASAGAGALEVQLDLSGSGANSSDGTGALDLGIDLSGAGAAASTGSGDLTVSAPNVVTLSASGDNAAIGAGDLTVSAPNIVTLAGSGASVSAGLGTADVTRGLAGSGVAASTAQAALDLTVDIAGAGAAAATGFGQLVALRALSGAGANVSAGQAVLGVGTPGFVRIESGGTAATLINSDSAVTGVESDGLVSSGIEGA